MANETWWQRQRAKHPHQWDVMGGAGTLFGGAAKGFKTLYSNTRAGLKTVGKYASWGNTAEGGVGVFGAAVEGRRAILEGMADMPHVAGLMGMGEAKGGERFAGRMVGGQLKVPGFFARTSGEHLRMGAVRMVQQFKPSWMGLEVGIGLGLAMMDTDFNEYANPYDGVARKFATNVGATPGFLAGAAAGAAVGNIVPVVGTTVGFIAGGLLGSTVSSAAADLPWKLGDVGRRIRMNRTYRPGFQDSESSYTMRQLTEQMMRGSMMNARSSLGYEALSFH